MSSWIAIDQDRIDRFACVSGDDGFIHVDPVAAAVTPFGTTIAHGQLLLSLTGAMGKEVLPAITDRAHLLNYDCDRVRLLSPVSVRSRVRGRYRLDEAVERSAKERGIIRAILGGRAEHRWGWGKLPTCGHRAIDAIHP